MLNRERIAEGLNALLYQLANGEMTGPPGDWTDEEWAYVKGIASACILFWRGRLLEDAAP